MKRKTKKSVSILLCMVMLLSLTPLTAFANESKAVKITDEAKSEKITNDLKTEKTKNGSKAEKVTEDSNSTKITKDSDSGKITDEAKFISLEEAKEIVLKDAELDRNKQRDIPSFRKTFRLRQQAEYISCRLTLSPRVRITAHTSP